MSGMQLPVPSTNPNNAALVDSRAVEGSDTLNPASTSVIKVVAGSIFNSETREFIGVQQHWNRQQSELRSDDDALLELIGSPSPRQGRPQVITISPESGLIVDVSPLRSSSPSQALGEGVVENINGVEVDFNDPSTIDLRHSTILPGFVDVHVHFFLHPYTETKWEDQLLEESPAERTIRATNHAKATLLSGFTTVRDLGTEGAGDADIGLRKCLSGPDALISGPRYYCANRAVVTTGSYGPKSSSIVNKEGIDGVTGAEVADGITDCVKAVRRQVGAGADWVKIYADYRVRSRLADVSVAPARAAIRTFSDAEIRAMIECAHELGVKVAAHAAGAPAITSLLRFGIDSIEHGCELLHTRKGRERASSTAQIQQSQPRHRPIFWAPTLAAYEATDSTAMMNVTAASFKKVVEEEQHGTSTVSIVCGGDTGVFSHGMNVRELQLMVKLGAPWRDVLSWATYRGWLCVRSMDWEGPLGEERLSCVDSLSETRGAVGDNEMPFGIIRKGFSADLIATKGDFEKDFDAAVSRDSINFVMKCGRVYKRDGESLVY